MVRKDKSKELFSKAKEVIPGGVNSPVRAFKSVGGEPLFIKSAKGAFLYDQDGNEYIDLINSWGPMILGHAHELVGRAVIDAVPDSLSFGAPSEKEVQIAGLIVRMIPSIEKVRMVNSGTEATMSAVRLARGFTRRNKIIKFEGCYHGHGDSFLIAAGSGAMTLGIPDSPGVTMGTAADTLTAPYNDLAAVRQLVNQNVGEVAAIIVEPVAGNMGCILPMEEFLPGLRDLCDHEGIVLIFDEVMTGFRLARGGAQEYYQVLPDITTLGKIIGGGMPVGAYGGKMEIMDYVAPQGPVYQAGTLSGNPIAMAAGYEMLKYLDDHPEVYTYLSNITETIAEGIRDNIEKLELNYVVNQLGSMFSLFFTDKLVYDLKTAKTSDTRLFGQYFLEMLEQGVYLAPSQFESLFVSTSITDELAQKIINANFNALKKIHGK
jgi:glutamate-1-semialdehyde 2,1-aminomutase